MLGWFRARRTITAAAFVLLAAATVANHGLGGHDVHGPWLVAHDADAHAFTDGTSAAHGETLHCVLCQLTRTGATAPLSARLSLEPLSVLGCRLSVRT
jgi:hypothetical protein